MCGDYGIGIVSAFGGKIDLLKDSGLYACAERELLEETGIQNVELQLIGIGKVMTVQNGANHFVVYYKCLVSKDVQLVPENGCSMFWVDREDIHTYRDKMWANDIFLFDTLLQSSKFWYYESCASNHTLLLSYNIVFRETEQEFRFLIENVCELGEPSVYSKTSFYAFLERQCISFDNALEIFQVFLHKEVSGCKRIKSQ